MSQSSYFGHREKKQPFEVLLNETNADSFLMMHGI